MSRGRLPVALLDVNLLIALFDPVHVHHELAHAWFGPRRRHGWATCPMTENGLVRILSSPAYPGRGTSLPDALARLATFRAAGHHEFWADGVSLCDPAVAAPRHIAGPGQVTDVYLLALAVDRDGTLATFDRGLTLRAVRRAAPRHLTRIG